MAIEIQSFSKSHGFTGLRCGFSVFPEELMVFSQSGEEVPLIKLWSRRNANYTNGVSYVVQRGAEATYSRKGKTEMQELISYYRRNTSLIRNQLMSEGFKVYGGIDYKNRFFR